MKYLINLFFVLLIFSGCNQEVVKKENRSAVEVINIKVQHIDANHRVRIVEDDFQNGDSIFKIRAFYMDDDLIKMVNVLRTSHIERDDYFYFENNAPIFSGHMMNQRDDHSAAEYKYYYKEGRIFESLFWKDFYQPGKKFPHEYFAEFEPDIDSLMDMEKSRLTFSLKKLDMEGFEILHLNENLDANK